MAILMRSATSLLCKAGLFSRGEGNMIGGRFIMKEKVSMAQYILLPGIAAGSVMVIAGTVF